MHISGSKDQTTVKELSPLSADASWMTTVRSPRRGSGGMRSETGEDGNGKSQRDLTTGGWGEKAYPSCTSLKILAAFVPKFSDS